MVSVFLVRLKAKLPAGVVRLVQGGLQHSLVTAWSREDIVIGSDL